MYTLLRQVPTRLLLLIQAPSFLIAFLIAEFFYKFKSFALECVAFLITWFVIDACINGVRSLWMARQIRRRPERGRAYRTRTAVIIWMMAVPT